MPIKLLVALSTMIFIPIAQAQQPAQVQNQPQQQPQAPAQQTDPAETGADEPLADSSFLTPFNYEPRGRRDPFQPPLDEKPIAEGVMHGPFLPLQKFDLTQIKLSAIIWDVAHPKAMLTDPDGKVYIVGPNTKIGKNNGYIAVIREGEMVIIETTEDNGRLLSATRILRLAVSK